MPFWAALMASSAIVSSPAAAETVRGRVIDGETGSAVNGAIISAANGRTATTGSDGAFLLDTLGAKTLKVEALGFEAKQIEVIAGQPLEITLDRDDKTIVVRGVRLGQARALNDQRAADNTINVQSADEAGRFPDNNVAESLSRLPGITLVRDQQTGEGQLVTIRGLDSGLNVFTVNGVRLAQTQTDRQIALDTLPTDGYQQLRVSKTSTPDMDGDAIGGTVELRTPTAFDYGSRRYGLSIEGAYQDRGDGAGEKLSGNFASKFGPANNFGFYGSFYAGSRDTLSEESENEGEWEPFLWRRDANVAIDENSLLLPGVGLDLYENQLERSGGNFSLDWRPTDQLEFYLRGQYGQFDRNVVNNGLVVRSIASPRLATPTAPAGNSLWSANGPGGVWNPARSRVDRYVSDRDFRKTQGFAAIGSEWSTDRFDLSAQVSYSTGEESSRSYSLEYRADGGLAGTADDYFLTNGVTFSIPDQRFPQWLLVAPGNDLVYNDSVFRFNGGSISNDEIKDSKTIAELDLTYRISSGLVESLAGGAKLVRSERERDQNRELSASATEVNARAATRSQAATLGLVGGEYGSLFDGAYSGARRFGTVYNPAAVRALLNGLTLGRETPTINSNLQNDNEGSEDVFAVYGLAKLRSGRWDSVIGLRAEQTTIDNTFFRSDTGVSGTTGFASSSSDYTNVLPSIHVNYRTNENLVFRSAIWTSISRPEFQIISGRETVTRNASGLITSISRGNPDLKPAESLNFDLGAEWYNDRVGLAQVAVYHKKIDNFIFLNNAITNSVLNPDGINISQPQNGTEATVTGVEFGFQQQLRTLPSPFDGLGLILNATLQETEASTGDATRIPLGRDDIPLINAPDVQGNVSLFYEKYGIEARLSYNYSGAYIEDTRDNGIDKWIQAWDRVDFSARYTVPKTNFSIGLEAQNLLDSHAYWATKGQSAAYQKDYVESGRNFFLTVSFQR
jgi:TonB-dependent receptor